MLQVFVRTNTSYFLDNFLSQGNMKSKHLNQNEAEDTFTNSFKKWIFLSLNLFGEVSEAVIACS